jgi:hypothetical protein
MPACEVELWVRELKAPRGGILLRSIDTCRFRDDGLGQSASTGACGACVPRQVPRCARPFPLLTTRPLTRAGAFGPTLSLEFLVKQPPTPQVPPPAPRRDGGRDHSVSREVSVARDGSQARPQERPPADASEPLPRELTAEWGQLR